MARRRKSSRGSSLGKEKKKKEEEKKKNSHKGINVTRDSSLMARKRSTCPWTCAWKKGLSPPPLSLSTSFPFVIVPLCTRAGLDRKPIFGAGRSTSLTDEWRANIDSPRGNWGTRRACNTSLCATSADEKSMGRLWTRPPFFAPLHVPRALLHISMRSFI